MQAGLKDPQEYIYGMIERYPSADCVPGVDLPRVGASVLHYANRGISQDLMKTAKAILLYKEA